MNYIYNIKVNMMDHLINFYEWNESDNIVNINRIVLYLVDTKDYLNILSMNVKLNNQCLEKLSLHNDMCLFTNGIDTICVKFNESGEIVKISKLMISDEMDILDDINYKNKIKLSYKITNKNNNYKFITRDEEKIIRKVSEFLDSNKHNTDIIDYLYYEWFNTTKGINKYDKLVNAIKGEFSIKHKNVYEIINLMEVKNV